MSKEFKVTDHGLQIDGRGIMPGSVLVLKSDPPAHWQRFGNIGPAPEKTLQVATPPKKPRGRPPKNESAD